MPTDAKLVRDHFLAAVELPIAERSAYLTVHCGADPELRVAIERLLSAHDQPAAVLNQPVAGESELTQVFLPGERPGVIIADRYKLLEVVGEGGMGAVWVAEQTQPVRRKVALKLIKAGMDSKSVIARFEAERQALAVMDHPNVAKVLDGGLTETGRPFFVMEYVKGVPITQYCDAARLSVPERLQLFAQVCQAVQHAHQKGIIHRDLKPSNILVAPYDDRPIPKIIDFGLAKAMHHSLTEKTLHTAHESVLGTPLYMSPEQAQLNNLDVDTRSDIYSLGVLLYELLTGTTPLEKQRFTEAAWDEILRLIREEEPPRPSTRLSSTDTLPSLAAHRHTEPLKLTSQIRGELDWIVMKALEKDRTRRYETANGFAADVLRYLAGEPVQAHPPSTAYRLKKFVKRNRGPVSAASLVLLALVGGVIGTTLGLLEARRQEDLARAESQKREEARAAEAVQRLIAEQKEQDAVAATSRETTQRLKAEQARDRTRQVLDAMTSGVTGDSLETQVAISAEQKKFLSEVLTYYREFAGEKADDEQARARTAAAAQRIGLIEYRLGRKSEAVVAFEMARDGYRKLADEFPAVFTYRESLASNYHNLGKLLDEMGKQFEGAEQFRMASAIFEKLVADFPDVFELRSRLAGCYNASGVLLTNLGKLTEAEREIRRALAIQEKLAAEFPEVHDFQLDLAGHHNNLGNLLDVLGNPTEAETTYRRALAIHEKMIAEFPEVPSYRFKLAANQYNLAGLLKEQGKPSEAEDRYGRAVAIQEKLAAEFPAVPEYRHQAAKCYNDLGHLQMSLGKQPEAEKMYRMAMAILENLTVAFPADPTFSHQLANSCLGIAMLLEDQGKGVEAEQEYRRTLAIQEKLAAEYSTVPAYHRDLAATRNNFGILLVNQGKPTEAEEQYREAIAIREKLAAEFPTVPEYRSELAWSHNNRANLFRKFNRRVEAEAGYRQVMTIWEKLTAEFPSVPEYRLRLAGIHHDLASLLNELARRAEAEEQYRRALPILEKLADEFPTVSTYQTTLGSAFYGLGLLNRAEGKVTDGLEWYAKAIRTLTPVYERDPRDATAKQMLRNGYWGRAAAYDRLRKHGEAVADWDQAIELSSKEEEFGLRAVRATSLVQAGQPAQAMAEVDVLAKQSNWKAEQWYGFAHVYAIAAGKESDKKEPYSDRAMELLQQAAKAGYKDAARMEKDTNLDVLRDRDDFKELLAELEKRPDKK